jgi:hypothetical protein
MSMQPHDVTESKRPQRIVAAIFVVVGLGAALYLVLTDGGSITAPVMFSVVLALWSAVCGMVGYGLVELILLVRRPRVLAAVLFLIAALLLAIRAEIWYWHYTTSPAYAAKQRARRLANWEPSGDTFRAVFEAREAIKLLLKCPSTARVEGSADYRGGGRYRVSGHVDAENSFGAMKRGYFTCTVIESPDGWATEDLEYVEP